jgi:hypothetical protein
LQEFKKFGDELGLNGKTLLLHSMLRQTHKAVVFPSEVEKKINNEHSLHLWCVYKHPPEIALLSEPRTF